MIKWIMLAIACISLVIAILLPGTVDKGENPLRIGTAVGRTDFTSPGWEGCYSSILWVQENFNVIAVRCPNSSTSVRYQSGKISRYVPTVDHSSVEAARQLIEQDNARKQALDKLTEQDRKLLGLEND